MLQDVKKLRIVLSPDYFEVGPIPLYVLNDYVNKCVFLVNM